MRRWAWIHPHLAGLITSLCLICPFDLGSGAVEATDSPSKRIVGALMQMDVMAEGGTSADGNREGAGERATSAGRRDVTRSY